jgi:glycosyltransferase involved in cell wall biosynthesis
MKVCMDIQPAVAQRAGVGRYTKCLAKHLGPLRGGDELSLFYFDFRRRGLPFAVPGATARAVRWCPGRVVQHAWRTLNGPPFDWYAGPADLYHFPNFIRPPLSRGRSVVTIHDVAFLRYPETIEERNYRYLTRCMERTVKDADAIIAVSRFTADEIAELLEVPRDRLYVVHEGLDESMQPASETAVDRMRQTLGLDRPYLLTVGTLEPRKNLLFLMDVWEQLTGFDGDLVIAGMPGWKHGPILERIQCSLRADRIRYLQFVKDRHLPALYSGAELFVYPSLYEGFGFPPLEAMACGTAVVSSAGGSLPEVLGGAAMVLDTFDIDLWTKTLQDSFDDAERKSALVEQGVRRASGFNWAEAARGTWDVYRQVAV